MDTKQKTNAREPQTSDVTNTRASARGLPAVAQATRLSRRATRPAERSVVPGEPSTPGGSANAFPTPPGKLPGGTGRWPVPPAAAVVRLALMLAFAVAAFTAARAVTPPDPSWVNTTIAEDESIYSSIALGPDETLYFGTRGGKIVALDKYNEEKWTYTPVHNFSTYDIWASAALNVENTKLFIGDDGGWFYCLDPKDGSSLGSYQTGGGIRGTAAVASSGDYSHHVYIASADGNLYCFDQDDLSQPVWTTDIDNDAVSLSELHSSPVIAPDEYVYIGSADGNLRKIDPDDGSVEWDFQTGDKIEGSPAIGENGWVFFGSYDGWVYALDQNGQLKWKSDTGWPVKSSPVISSSGLVYIGSDSYHVYAFDAYDDAGGTVQPVYTSPVLSSAGSEFCAGLVMDMNGMIYVATFGSNRLYCFQPDLDIEWEFNSVPSHTMGGVYGAAALGPDGSLYVADISSTFGQNKGKIFKFPVGAPLAANVWPAFQRDMWRSGNGRLNSWPRDPDATISELTPFYSGTASFAYTINNPGTVGGTADGIPNYPYWSWYTWDACYWPANSVNPSSGYPYWSSSSALSVRDINDIGDRVGYVSGDAFFRWFNGIDNWLSAPSSPTSARGITEDASIIVGYSGNRAMRWDATGSTQDPPYYYNGVDLGNLGDFNYSVTTYAYDISYDEANNEWRVVGQGRTSETGPYHAFRTLPNELLGDPNGNDDLGTLSGDEEDTSKGLAISRSGYVVGSSKTTGGETHAFRFTGSTYKLYPWMDLGTLGGNFSVARGVNNLGQVVGYSRNAQGSYRAFLWIQGEGMIDLNTKLPQGSGWTLINANGINDEGWIVGYGVKNGDGRAWIMKPEL